ncbi:ABC transporter permease [Synechococcus sp. Cruz-9H2]|uniref:ABC transporter permease n=1 Tax=unclassified Synechococcus TaxID=2626047 RepID=UPI0020CBBBF8|nr:MULTISPECIES: ABC transporter permease [unclassified Synechococcus]MCP9819890.1 ABC transporter permease [Synechococcus sp. Cruz-9H2]MCP9856320.1 ABC transporter permease [Synechococcus sp. Cruz-9C9]MCP9863605.1 ABC transporter permease [Synechococcus sp. Cruz-7E5]MCP9870801.1 ABC transporter permease [Synechococcus sp. Cruz-7B9]
MTMLSLRDTFQSAAQSLVAHPLRSCLTMLGVIIGNASFVAMASLGEAAKVYTVQRLEAFHGPNRLIAYATANEPGQKITREPKLYLGDALALGAGTPAIRSVAPVVGATFLGRVREQSQFLWVTGTTAAYLGVKNEAVAQGRFFSQEEVAQTARVAVLGSSIAKRFFPDGKPVGETMTIKNMSFRVIGVMRSKGSLDKTSPDEFVYVPLSTFSLFLRGTVAGIGIPVDYIEIAAASKQQVNDAIFQATNLLAARRGVRDFAVAPNIPYKDLIAQVSSTLTIFLAVLAGISLIIGGIGIMNVMLVTVSERTREIGLRKAIGASNRSILVNFLIESTLLSAAGGLIGLVVGVGGVVLVAIVTPLPFIVSYWAILVSVLLSTSIGVISGVSPALRASRLDPIVALRAA